MKERSRVRYIVRLAVLVAILLLLEVTGLGYLPVSALTLTIMQIPVVVGAIVLGPTAGTVLGTVFGLTSFFQCFGKNAFGVALMSINPFLTFVVCVVPRVLMGFLCGVIFKALAKKDRTKWVSYGVASLSGAVLNTLFFMAALMLCFGQTEYIRNMMGGMNIIPFVIAFVGLQGLVEAIVCFVAGTAVSKALSVFDSRSSKAERI
jgi:uncharacterized membrane protein